MFHSKPKRFLYDTTSNIIYKFTVFHKSIYFINILHMHSQTCKLLRVLSNLHATAWHHAFNTHWLISWCVGEIEFVAFEFMGILLCYLNASLACATKIISILKIHRNVIMSSIFEYRFWAFLDCGCKKTPLKCIHRHKIATIGIRIF